MPLEGKREVRMGRPCEVIECWHREAVGIGPTLIPFSPFAASASTLVVCVYSSWNPQCWLKALYFIFSSGSLHPSDFHRRESGRFRTLPFFLIYFKISPNYSNILSTFRSKNISNIEVPIDLLIGLVVSISDYWSWGRGFDSRHFHKF